MPTDQDRQEVGELARDLAQGYYAFVVAHLVATNPTSINSLPYSGTSGLNPIGKLPRKDGTYHQIDTRYYLDLLRENRIVQGRFLRAWATSSIVLLGEALRAHSYFDHAPILEVVYHLRNGLAHGNKFNIDYSGKRRLEMHPAHTRDAIVMGDLKTTFEITPDLEGPVLFDFMGAGDIVDVLQSVEVYLNR